MSTLPEVGVDAIPKYAQVDVDGFDPEYLGGILGTVVDEIKSRWGSVVERRLASGALTKRLYESVVVRVAARVFSNTDGFKKENEGQYGYEVSALVSSGYIWFSDIDERALTGHVASKRNGRAGTAMVQRVPRWR